MNYTIKRLDHHEFSLAKRLFIFFQEDDGENPLIPTDNYLKQLLFRNDFHVIVALHNETIIGGLTAYELPMYKEAINEIFLYEIGVEPQYRKQGIAIALIEDLKKLAVSRGIPEMYVGAMAENTPARKLYEKTGGKYEEIAWFVYDLEK